MSSAAASIVSVAVPVRDGAATLEGVLEAVRGQILDRELELLVCDSGSRDASVQIARRHGARVLQIAPDEFAHGTTRNRLLGEARGAHVALLTQDAEPVDERWLARLLAGFEAAENVGVVYGPYRPRPDASPQTARQLRRWFHSLAPDGRPRVDRLEERERALPALSLFGRRTFLTDANACLSRAAWRHVPFRAVAYAEDHALALDMLRAGYAKVFVPDAAVWHSHEYTTLQQFRRAFDEWRALREIYGWREPADPRRVLGQLRGELGAQRRELRAEGVSGGALGAALAGAAASETVRLSGALLGSRADRLPAGLRRWCSLEGRGDVGGVGGA